METTTEQVLDVTKLAPMVKHSTIFGRIAALKPGESLVIHNDHDPKPLYFQLQHTHGGSVSWEYLEQGPQWWKVRIGKVEGSETPLADDVLDVTKLEPSVKHATIFDRIDALQPGESLTIHNDHDPVPLRYHLEDVYGDAFTWDYLEKGPRWWKVKIGMRPLHTAQGNVLDVTKLEPRVKHATIFQRYHALEDGQSLTIHNDHDPKPLYYQMLGELGNVFTWEYLEQGPEWWKVKITKRNTGMADETLGEIAVKDLRKAEVFKKFGLDFCCGGRKTVREACEEKGIDPAVVERELQQATNVQAGTPLPYNEWALDFLADFIVNTHHAYLRKNLPDLLKYAAKVAQVHGERHPELHRVNELAQAVASELGEHMIDEETGLFPYVKELVAAKNNGQPLPATKQERFQETLDKLLDDHVAVGAKLDEINSLTGGYTLPEDACASYGLLFKMLDDLEDDVHVHIHLENNILFPKATELEASFK